MNAGIHSQLFVPDCMSYGTDFHSEFRVPGTAMDYLHSGPINRCWYWSDIQIEEVLVPVEVVGSEESNF